MKKLLTLCLLAFIPCAHADPLPVGRHVQPLVFITNNGTVYMGSNQTAVLTFTNAAAFTAPVTFSGAVTNSGTLVMSNSFQLGARFESVGMVGLSSITNHDLAAGDASFLVLTNQTAGDIVITGFLPGAVGAPKSATNTLWFGRLLQVVNATGTNCTLLASSEAASTNSSEVCRILLPAGTSTNLGGRGTATLLYFSTNWHLINLMP